MNIKFLGCMPDKCYIAFSGGSDSSMLLHFLSKYNKREITLLYFNHGTEHGEIAQAHAEKVAEQYAVPIVVGHLTEKVDRPTEHFWRNQRYAFFDQFKEAPIVMAHTLTDQVETYLYYMIRGYEKLMPYQRGNVIRPLLLTPRSKIKKYLEVNEIPFLNDPSNYHLHHSRVRIRHNIIPEIEKINPGLEKVIRKKMLQDPNYPT
jgi:tRNA(Ile)-lysidine synthase